MFKNVMIVICCSLLASCSYLSGTEFIEDEDVPGGIIVENKTFKGTYMMVPDYYSTQQIDKKYKTGQTYYVRDLQCKDKTNECTN